MNTKRDAANSTTLTAARAALEPRLRYEEFLAKLFSAKERASAQQHLDTHRGPGGDPRYAALWERIVTAMLTLAPALPKFGGRRAAQFSIPDGKYKLQVFALQEDDGGVLHVYCPDVRPEAQKAGLVRGGAKTDGGRSYLGGGPVDGVLVEEIEDSGGEQRPAECVRPMLGWGKKALHLTLKADASESQISAVEQVCAVAALKWKPAASASKADAKADGKRQKVKA
jgi:hypothetical protein